MRGRRWIAGGAWLGVAALLMVAALRPPGATASPPTVGRVYADTLPAGAGFEIAGRACMMCHSVSLIVQQHKDSTAWEKTLTQMDAWGAPFVGAERDTLRDYLLEHFGPRP